MKYYKNRPLETMAVQFKHEKNTLTVNLVPELTGLYRLNAMTHYNHVKPYMISAHFFNERCEVNQEVKHYQVFTVEKGWVQISKEIGDELLKHPKVVGSRTPTLNKKNLAIASAAIAGSVCLIMKIKKK